MSGVKQIIFEMLQAELALPYHARVEGREGRYRGFSEADKGRLYGSAVASTRRAD